MFKNNLINVSTIVKIINNLITWIDVFQFIIILILLKNKIENDNNDNKDKSSKNKTIAIVCGTVGGAIVIICTIIISVICIKKKK